MTVVETGPRRGKGSDSRELTPAAEETESPTPAAQAVPDPAQAVPDPAQALSDPAQALSDPAQALPGPAPTAPEHAPAFAERTPATPIPGETEQSLESLEYPSERLQTTVDLDQYAIKRLMNSGDPLLQQLARNAVRLSVTQFF
tara:strand:- start:524 stop:955 length:432 start_codon:yes stop_codon:yes gene_type:complete